MIHLQKLAEPVVLVKNGETWTAEFLSLRAAGSVTPVVRFRYRHPMIKERLRAETSEKCAYCESKVSHVHPGETDHILPVSEKPELYVSWVNLTYVCSECNREKSDYYSDAEPLVNPYSDEPSDHLLFVGPLVLHRDAKGLRTQRKLKLSRTALVERKQEMLERLNLLVHQWNETGAGPTKDFLREEILSHAENGAEFAATVRAYLQIAGLI